MAKNDIIKINQIGKEMDGNTTHNEEQMFIIELAEQIPNVLKNIDATFHQIDYIDKQLSNKPNLETLSYHLKETSEKVD